VASKKNKSHYGTNTIATYLKPCKA